MCIIPCFKQIITIINNTWKQGQSNSLFLEVEILLFFFKVKLIPYSEWKINLQLNVDQVDISTNHYIVNKNVPSLVTHSV